MKIPPGVTIHSHHYKVLMRHSRTISKIVGSESVGHADIEHHLIYIASDVPRSRQMEIMLHEMLHVIDEAVQARSGERRISALSEGLYSVLHTNKLRF